jgi:3-oxoacyl-[acyl-carrier protein] reductase
MDRWRPTRPDACDHRLAVSSPSRPLEGRVALVTGANHGIGAATGRALAKRGALVLLAYLRLEPPRRRHSGQLRRAPRAAGDRAVALEADLADPAVPAALFDAAERDLGPVEILVHNASGWLADSFAGEKHGPLDRRLRPVSAATFDRQFAVDARAGAVLIAELARRHVACGARRGRIVTLTSGGATGFPGEVSYGAAKAALENYTMSAAVELADHGITANVLYPPVTDTGWVTGEVRDWVRASTDHVHVARPKEVAEVIAWLAGDDARLVTGNVVRLR